MMTTTGRIRTIAVALALLGGVAAADAQTATQQDIQELKQLLQKQEDSIRQLKARIQQLEGAQQRAAAPAKAKPPAVAAEPAPAPTTPPKGAPSPAEEAEAKMLAQENLTRKSPVRDRGNMDDRQEAAPRPGDFTLDPQYRGYIEIPHTVFLLKFNPKPRVDVTTDTRNSGDDFRFVPAKIPTKGSAAYGGGEQFNINGNGSQLRLDMRAPSVPGNFRIYYQNDFFGSDTKNFQYRLQHFYGQYYGFVGGFTYGVFEDPDAWPDTVDYEGPNSVIFARRPLLHYTHEFGEHWNATVGVEDPDIFVDTTSQANASQVTHAPDFGFNVRWEPGDLGHVQFGTIFRSIGARNTTMGNQNVFGWGIDLATVLAVTPRDTATLWGVYGTGVGGMGNDTSFVNSDAAFDAAGNLHALDYASALAALTHNWTDRWRSTATFGAVYLANTSGQEADAYHRTYYASGNLVYQLFKRLSVGGEVLYGYRRVRSGDGGDVVRFQVGAVYSVFD